MAGLTEFAENNQFKASHFTAIGAFHEALFGWFDGEKKAYKKIPITQQVELISLVGDIGLVNGKPVVHAHGVVGLARRHHARRSHDKRDSLADA